MNAIDDRLNAAGRALAAQLRADGGADNTLRAIRGRKEAAAHCT